MKNKYLTHSLDEFTKEIKNFAKKSNDIDRICIELFEFVRDIPYGTIGSRDLRDVFKKNKGTCSGKHELLKYLFKLIDIKVSDIIVMHAFNDLPVAFPQKIMTLFESGDILDPHNVIRIHSKGQWHIVDATWDSPLEQVGFPVNRDWDGKSGMKLCVVEREIIETNNPIETKKLMIKQLPQEMQERRKKFLKDLTIWLDKVR